jgi:hypothetical protein
LLPSRLAFPGNRSPGLTEILDSGPSERPVAIVDRINNLAIWPSGKTVLGSEKRKIL